MRKEDYNFIVSTWSRGLYYGNDWFNLIPQDIYFNKYRLVIDVLLNKPTVTILVLCLKDDHDVILGYSVFETKDQSTAIHWIFTKPVWRKMGVARMLTPPQVSEVSHLTNLGKAIKPKTWVFNPFL